jgi:acid-sensing ion channel, other
VAFTISIAICIQLSDDYQKSPLATVIDSTTFPVAEIPFPAVTICNRHHLDYTKLEMARKRFIPTASTQTGLVFDEIMRVINPLEFGSFDTFAVVRNKSFIGLDSVDFTAVADYVSDDISALQVQMTIVTFQMTHKCEDFLKNCFWRQKSVNCCDIFSRQKSEFGICYSFNSLSSVGTPFVNV